jgi:hypothetical protein
METYVVIPESNFRPIETGGHERGAFVNFNSDVYLK